MAETARQIADDLRVRIEAGEFPPGKRLPGEPALVKQYGVAKMTANGALKLLVNEGLAYSKPGSGTYVRDFQPLRRVANKRMARTGWSSGQSVWSPDLGRRDLVVADIRVNEVAAPRQVARALGLDSQDLVLVRSRRFLVDEKPVQLATTYYPASLVAGSAITQQNTGPGGAYARLAELGAEPVQFVEELRSRMPSGTEADLLALPAGTPVMEICRTAFTADGDRVEFNQMLLDAGSYVLEYHFTS
ncbi:GntR family transcriptional regulator [Embleya sp. NPDC050154]|uniref:GntR family transcriptional regulator n=1 Tax=Embleya sp. NPDC050154 TaxID=3363988 RepID=UPI0037B80D59